MTGKSGAGKSAACGIFKELSFSILDCDQITRNVFSDNSSCIKELEERFSDSIISEGKLNRKKTADVIFSDPKKKREYEFIVFPFITYSLFNEIIFLKKSGFKDIILDAPTLFESGADCLCNKIICVTSNTDEAAKRIMRRDGISVHEAQIRINAQKDHAARSDYEIKNNGGFDELKAEVYSVTNKLQGGNKSDEINV